jgi:hypothetical protein
MQLQFLRSKLKIASVFSLFVVASGSNFSGRDNILPYGVQYCEPLDLSSIMASDLIPPIFRERLKKLTSIIT